jgi:sugar-specific transcriptional regulator TrmB
MYDKILQQTLLSKDQALIYSTLLKAGALPAGQIAKKTPLKRALVYKVLDQLVDLGLIKKETEKSKVAIFAPEHPSKIKDLFEKKQLEASQAQSILESIMPNLVSDFNLISDQPYVKFAEGKEGIIKIYEELLNENAPIDSIEDKGEMGQFIPDYSAQFVKKRIKRGIFNRVICPTTNQINTNNPKELRETRVIPVNQYPLSMDIKIVKNKVSLITLQRKGAIGVLIDHHEISENFRLIFKYIWDSLGKKEKG